MTKLIPYLVLLLAGFALGGCAIKAKETDPFKGVLESEENLYYWGVNTFLAGNEKPFRVNPEQYCTPANDKTQPILSRRVDAALLFGLCIQPGYTSQQMRRSIPNPQWLNECSLSPVGGGGGGLPLPLALSHGSGFLLELFPDKVEPSKAWVIYFTLSGRHMSEQNALDFLKGNYPDNKVKLLEYVMFYPLAGCDSADAPYVLERHSSRGVGIIVRTANYD